MSDKSATSELAVAGEEARSSSRATGSEEAR